VNPRFTAPFAITATFIVSLGACVSNTQFRNTAGAAAHDAKPPKPGLDALLAGEGASFAAMYRAL